jgi:hypothetical protein
MNGETTVEKKKKYHERHHTTTPHQVKKWQNKLCDEVAENKPPGGDFLFGDSFLPRPTPWRLASQLGYFL